MIDFKNASFAKLKPIPAGNWEPAVSPMFVSGEQIIEAFQGIRDGVIFTNKRIGERSGRYRKEKGFYIASVQ